MACDDARVRFLVRELRILDSGIRRTDSRFWILMQC